MATSRNGSEIRVERSEHKVRVNGWLSFLVPGAIATYGAFLSDSLTDWLLVAAFFALGLHLIRHNFKRRDVVVITPDRIGHGPVGGELTWIDRTGLHSVYIADNVIFQIQLFDPEGKLRNSFVLSNFDSKELRQAFSEAGFEQR